MWTFRVDWCLGFWAGLCFEKYLIDMVSLLYSREIAVDFTQRHTDGDDLKAPLQALRH